MRVLLVPNTAKAEAIEAATEVASWLADEGFEPVLLAADARAAGLGDFGVEPEAIGETGLVVAFGGDGTILRAVEVIGEAEVPVLGINLGRLGFLSGAGLGAMRSSIVDALAGDVVVERRKTLRAEVEVDGAPFGRFRALNEVVLARGGGANRVVSVELLIAGTKVAHLRADGIIVATPTGSTAYALSAGGPIVSPEVSGLIVVPIAPHTLASRPIVAGPSDTVEIIAAEPERSESCLTIDGDATPCRGRISRLVVSRGETDVLLVKHDGRDFYRVVAQEFFGG